MAASSRDFAAIVYFVRFGPLGRSRQVALPGDDLHYASGGQRVHRPRPGVLQDPHRLQRSGARPLRSVSPAPAAQRQLLSFASQGDLIYRISTDTNGFIAAFNVVFGLLVNSITLAFMFAIMLR